MDSEILLYIKDISIEMVIISLCIFGLTMLIKWPIKKATAKLTENRRKAINTIIVFIPMILSLIMNVLYFGLFKKIWFGTQVIESVGSCYIFAVLIYAVYSRIILIVKGIKSENASDFSKQSINVIKTNIKNISATLKLDETKLNNIILEIEKLLKIRDEIKNNMSQSNNEMTKTLDINIESLMSQKIILENSIAESKKQLLLCENSNIENVNIKK